MTTHLHRSSPALLISSLLSLILAGSALALPEVSVDSVKQLEGQPGAVKKLTLTFRLNESISAQPTSINYRLEPVTARPGEDYVDRSGTMQFGFGVPEVVNLITLVADRVEEGSEQFRVVLSNPVGCTLAPSTAGSGLQTIVDDDGMLLMHDTGSAPNIVRKVSTLTSDLPSGSSTRSAVLVENVGGQFSTLGDADGDELADIFRLNVTATESRLDVLSGGDGTTPLLATVPLDMTGAGLMDVAAGDVTGDGLDDLVELRFRPSDDLRTVVVRAAPAFGETYWQSLAPGQRSTALRLSDINDDGCSDVHVQGYGLLEVLNGRTLARLIYSGAPNSIYGCGDVTGDGRPDAMLDDATVQDDLNGHPPWLIYTPAVWNSPSLIYSKHELPYTYACSNLCLPQRGVLVSTNRVVLKYSQSGVWYLGGETFPGFFQVPRRGMSFLSPPFYHWLPLIPVHELPTSMVCLGVWARPADSLDDRNGLVRNPSFEMNANTYPGYGAISAWRTNSLISTGVNNATQPFADNSSVPDRQQVAFLQVDPTSGHPTASLSQQITRLTVGQLYWLQFRYNARAFHTGSGAVSLQARFGGVTLHTVPLVSAVGNLAEYTSVSVPFTAAAKTGLLEFIATGTDGDATVLLDAVSLTARSASDVLLTNPGFEATGRLQGDGYTKYPGEPTQAVSGWTFQGQGGTNLSTYDRMADNGTDVEGEMVAFLFGDGSRLSQTVNGLTPGARYTLSYLVNARHSRSTPRPNPEPPTQYQVFAGSGNEASPVLSQVPVGEGQPYARMSHTFVASRSSAEIVFLVIAPEEYQTLLLDDIRLAPAAPLEPVKLDIAPSSIPGTVDLIWPASAPAGLILQSSPSLASNSWTTVNAVPSLSGGFRRVNQPVSGPKRFFRLAQP